MDPSWVYMLMFDIGGPLDFVYFVAPSGSGCSTTAQIWHLWSPDLKRRSMQSGSFRIIHHTGDMFQEKLLRCIMVHPFQVFVVYHDVFHGFSWEYAAPCPIFWALPARSGRTPTTVPSSGLQAHRISPRMRSIGIWKNRNKSGFPCFCWNFKWCRLDLPSGNLT